MENIKQTLIALEHVRFNRWEKNLGMSNHSGSAQFSFANLGHDGWLIANAIEALPELLKHYEATTGTNWVRESA